MKRNHSLTHKFIIYLIVIIIISNCLVFALQFALTYRNMKEQSVRMELDLLNSNLAAVEQYFDDIDNIAYSLIYNRDIVRFLKTAGDSAGDLNYLTGVQSLYFNSRPDLSLFFYKEGNYNTAYSLIKREYADDYRLTDWYRELDTAGDEKMVFVGDPTGRGLEYGPSVFYRISDLYTGETVGFLEIAMDLDSLKEKFLHSYEKIAGSTIVDDGGYVLFHDKLLIELDQNVYDRQPSGVYETPDYLISYGTSRNTGWHICMAASKRELFADQYRLIVFLFLALFVILIVTFFIARKLFSIITVNFRRLSDGMNRVREGDLLIHVEADPSDEIATLIDEFNEMVLRIKDLVATVEAKQTLLREAESTALQQQINPHFMHNIMGTIIGLASEGLDDEVITVSECMSNMLRYNTHFENITTLREEIEQIRNYIQVLKYRFADRFEVYYDIDEECMDFSTVKFTLQPLVENAMSHGLSDVWKGGILRIRVIREGDDISIMIFDNGAGIPPDKLDELNRRLAETTEKPLEYIKQYKSLGILNVHLRLRLYFGDTYSMEIFSELQKGTCFSIRIPCRPREISEEAAYVSGTDHR